MVDQMVKLDAGRIVSQVLSAIVQKGVSSQTAAEVKSDVVDEISKVIVNQTNQEPWYQSTVTIGALITLVTGGYAFIYSVSHDGWPSPGDFTTQIGPLIGAAVVFYGRWFQRKPLGG